MDKGSFRPEAAAGETSLPDYVLLQELKLQSLSQLTCAIGHDLNNILTVVGAYSELIQQKLGSAETMADPALEVGGKRETISGTPIRANPDCRKLVQEIRNASNRATSLIRELLILCRNQLLQPEVVDLNDIIRGVSGLLRRLLGEEIELVCKLSPDPCLVEVDRRQMEKILLHLGVTARDAIRDKGLVSITTEHESRGAERNAADQPHSKGPSFLLRISDTGRGIDEPVRLRILQSILSSEAPDESIEVALATVNRLVQSCRGQIDVTSDPDRGSTFTIRLPRASQP